MGLAKTTKSRYTVAVHVNVMSLLTAPSEAGKCIENEIETVVPLPFYATLSSTATNCCSYTIIRYTGKFSWNSLAIRLKQWTDPNYSIKTYTRSK